MFADDTLRYVCDKNLGFLLAKLESHPDIAIKYGLEIIM